MNNKYLIDKAKENRLKLFKKFYALQEGHPGSAFSIIDFLVMIYYNKYIRLRKKNRKKIVIDEVIMSKGHATVAQYPILHDLGVIPQKDWENWGKNKKSLLKQWYESCPSVYPHYIIFAALLTILHCFIGRKQ